MRNGNSKSNALPKVRAHRRWNWVSHPPGPVEFLTTLYTSSQSSDHCMVCFRVCYRQMLIPEELLPPSGEGHQSHSAGSVLFFSGGSSRKDFSLKTPLDLCPLSMPPDLFNFWHIICLSTGWRRQR